MRLRPAALDATVATLNGTVQPPPANWDPYATARAAGRSGGRASRQDPYYNAPQPCPPQPGPFTLPPVLATPYRFLR